MSSGDAIALVGALVVVALVVGAVIVRAASSSSGAGDDAAATRADDDRFRDELYRALLVAIAGKDGSESFLLMGGKLSRQAWNAASAAMRRRREAMREELEPAKRPAGELGEGVAVSVTAAAGASSPPRASS